jgi:ribonuclease HI
MTMTSDQATTPTQPLEVVALTVATDGACSGNPGPAGWAWVDEHGTWRNGGLLRATNQVGELLGLLHAVRDHHHVRHLNIEIDSIYALNTYKTWMDAHAARGWTTQAKKPTSNREIIEEMRAARDARRAAGQPPVHLVKVKGHARGRFPLNDAADDRATAASAQARDKQLGPWSGHGMTIGSVRG